VKTKVFLTGGSGFIGRNIIESLGSKYEILAPRHKELELTDENAVKEYFANNKIDVVLHCATKPGHRNVKDTSGLLYTNLKMFFNIHSCMAKTQKMIYIGSGSEYDYRYYLPKMKENYFDNHVPCDESGFSKYLIAKYIENSANCVNLRVFGMFGKYEDYAIRFISNAICKTIFDLPVTIKQNRKFDYVYISDLMPVIEYFIENDCKYKTYNITPDKSVELLEIAEIVKKISGTNLSVKVAEKGIGLEYSGDNTRIKKEIPALSFTPIERSIKELYQWYLNNKSSINKSALLQDK
jgi:UDP-glucose 4-epimerase